MADTIEQIILDVQSICPGVDPNLARLFVRDAARRTMEAYPWSWQMRRGQFVVPANVTSVSTGATCTVTEDSDVVEFSGAVAEETWIGRQFRTSTDDPIYDIIEYLSTTQVRISPPWAGDTASGEGWTVSQTRLVVPSDCMELLTVVSPRNRWQLHLGVAQEVLDANDPARSRTNGSPSILSPLDFVTTYGGGVDDALLVSGSGAKPVTGGTYTGQSDSIYTVQVTTGGIGGVAVFRWRKNEEDWVTTVTSDADSGNELQEGVTILWPSTSTFVLNDIFTIRTSAAPISGMARMELYPGTSSETILPYLYVARSEDLTDEGVRIPGTLARRGDIIREKALEFVAAYPGTQDHPNPYNQINRRDYHAANWLQLVAELAKQDNALFQRNVLPARRLPYAPWPFGGAALLQEYDPPYMYPFDVY